jgi:hypothetical protein
MNNLLGYSFATIIVFFEFKKVAVSKKSQKL